MRLPSALTGLLTIVVPIGMLCARAQAQEAPGQDAAAKDALAASESKGLPPRATPGDYQAHAQAGAVTIGAEFVGHSVPTPAATYTTEDFVIVEAGLFGPPEARTKLSVGDFTLRINGKKTALPSQPYGLSFSSLKDPEWEPPSKKKDESKPTLDNGGGQPDDSFHATPKMPIERKRTMQQRVQKASMLEGDRALPQAGLLFFEYRGKEQSIRSLELVYSGPAGNATIALNP